MNREPGAQKPEKLISNFLFQHSREVVRVDEVARALSISENQVRAHVDVGNFVAAPVGDAGTETKQHLRLMRFSVEAWLLNKISEQGIEMPIQQTPQLTWWREKLKKDKPKKHAH